MTQVTRALALGAVAGFLFAMLPACGSKPTSTFCQGCEGCCDDTGTCFPGISVEACGANAETCTACTAGQVCERLLVTSSIGGKCATPVAGAGGGSGTGGAGQGGGSSAGGGAATGGGAGTGGGSTGTCDATNCANGCCTAAGVCITDTSPTKCGAGGALCSPCSMGQTCIAGACTDCAGCVDPQTGSCVTTFTDDRCPLNGAASFCTKCDDNAGQTCRVVPPATIAGCQGGTTCNSTTCAGCCDGNDCKEPSEFSNAQCGTGTAGQACVTCTNGASCDVTGTGQCEGGGPIGGGTGGGLGVPGMCDSTTPCPSGQCCDLMLGLMGTCVGLGDPCGSLSGDLACLISDCTCQSSGQCR